MRILNIQHDGEPRRIATYLEVEEVEKLQGIPPQAVIGVLDGNGSLQVNALFREFLHETIGLVAPLDLDMQSAAKAHRDGRLVYVDSRVPQDLHPVPNEDILGWFQVRAGRIIKGSYLPNPGHAIEGANGVTAALGGMRLAMVNALVSRQPG